MDYNKNTLSLYVHWPWCLNKCPYCDFNSHAAKSFPEDDYIQALSADLAHQAELIGDRNLISIFFGGGTPSLMSPKSVEHIINEAQKHFSFSSDIEISLEANPVTFAYNKFASFQQAGINRLSIGVQSLRDQHLKFLGRQHSAADAIRTCKDALTLFNNVNIDLMYGLQDQTVDEWLEDLMYALKLGVCHLSAYQLTIEQQTVFHKLKRRNEISTPNDDQLHTFYIKTRETCEMDGFVNYEISNFCKPGFHCKHNLNVWRYNEYLGIGAGSHGRLFPSKNKIIATAHVKNPLKYITNHLLKNENMKGVSKEEAEQEALLMGLRTAEGCEINKASNTILNLKRKEISQLISMNLIEKSDSHLKLSTEGWSQLDGVLSLLIL